MEQAFSVKSYGQAPTPPTPLDQTPHSKSYGSAKALESGSSDLQKQQADWYAQAYAYYNNAVTSGDAQRPSDAEWNDFLNQMNWVYEQLYGGYQGAAPMSGEAPWGDEDTGPSVNEFGGTMGPDGNWVYDTPETEITYQPDGMRHDVYGYTNTLNVPSASAKVTYEITNDGLQPPSQVLKVIVKSAQGESVYYYHNYADPDFKLNINVPKATQVSGALPDDIMNKIKVGKYTAQGSAGDGSEAGVPADHVSDDGTNIYVGNGPDDTIDFGPASDGSDSVNDVQANSNHTFKNDDQVTVEQAPKGSDYDYILTVEHSDGSKDVYHLHKEYNTQLNGIPEHITFIIPGKNGKTSEAHPMIIGEGTDKEVMIVPQPFTDDFSVNGLESKEFNLKFPQKGEKADGKDSKDNKAVKAANTTVEGLAGVTGKSAEQIRAQIFDIY